VGAHQDGMVAVVGGCICYCSPYSPYQARTRRNRTPNPHRRKYHPRATRICLCSRLGAAEALSVAGICSRSRGSLFPTCTRCNRTRGLHHRTIRHLRSRTHYYSRLVVVEVVAAASLAVKGLPAEDFVCLAAVCRSDPRSRCNLFPVRSSETRSPHLRHRSHHRLRVRRCPHSKLPRWRLAWERRASSGPRT